MILFWWIALCSLSICLLASFLVGKWECVCEKWVVLFLFFPCINFSKNRNLVLRWPLFGLILCKWVSETNFSYKICLNFQIVKANYHFLSHLYKNFHNYLHFHLQSNLHIITYNLRSLPNNRRLKPTYSLLPASFRTATNQTQLNLTIQTYLRGELANLIIWWNLLKFDIF